MSNKKIRPSRLSTISVLYSECSCDKVTKWAGDGYAGASWQALALRIALLAVSWGAAARRIGSHLPTS